MKIMKQQAFVASATAIIVAIVTFVTSIILKHGTLCGFSSSVTTFNNLSELGGGINAHKQVCHHPELCF